MSLRKLLQVHQRAQQQQRSTFLFLRKVHVQHAAQAAELLQIFKGMWVTDEQQLAAPSSKQ
jgi:hypothetical protein